MRSRLEKSGGGIANAYNHLEMIATTNEGYHNLAKRLPWAEPRSPCTIKRAPNLTSSEDRRSKVSTSTALARRADSAALLPVE